MSTSPDLQPVRPLSTAQLHAVEGLAGGQSAKKVALRAGVNEKTLWRWRKLPEFIRALEHARAGTPTAPDPGNRSDAEVVEAIIHDPASTSKEKLDALKVKYALELRGRPEPHRGPDRIIYNREPGSGELLVLYAERTQ